MRGYVAFKFELDKCRFRDPLSLDDDPVPMQRNHRDDMLDDLFVGSDKPGWYNQGG